LKLPIGFLDPQRAHDVRHEQTDVAAMLGQQLRCSGFEHGLFEGGLVLERELFFCLKLFCVAGLDLIHNVFRASRLRSFSPKPLKLFQFVITKRGLCTGFGVTPCLALFLQRRLEAACVFQTFNGQLKFTIVLGVERLHALIYAIQGIEKQFQCHV
jgi:hypothetical protein